MSLDKAQNKEAQKLEDKLDILLPNYFQREPTRKGVFSS